MKRAYPVLLIVGVLLSPIAGSVLAQAPNVNGLTTIESDFSVQETVSRLQNTIESQGLLLLTTVNHAANAEGAGMELRPTQLVIFGNPQLGTQLMQDVQTVAIDLPQKYLVWQGEGGQVYVSYNEPSYLRARHALDSSDEVLSTVSGALSGLAGGATAADTEDTAGAAEATPEALPETGSGGVPYPWLVAGGGAILLALGMRLARGRRSGALMMLAGASVLLLSLPGIGTAQEAPEGVITVDSPHSVQDTVDRLRSTMQERGLTIVATVNHTQNAAGVDMELRPTQLIIFGNPQAGTPLMQASQTIGIDLPQKMLVWEDEAGQVHVSYNDPQYLADRHNLTGVDDALGQISDALAGLATAATGE